MRSKLLQPALLVFLLTAGIVACTHEPFPPPPVPIDEPLVPPGDTNSNAQCHPDTVYYNRDIQPLLNANCAYSGCHDAATASNGVNLSNYNSVISTADVRAFNPTGSDLYEVITETDLNKRMPLPPNAPLSAEQINTVRTWIMQGAQNLICEACDTVGLRYSDDLKIIFQNNCVNCHGNTNPSAGLSLSNYDQVKNAVLNTNLLARINGEPGVPVMPQGGLMDNCNIEKINIWVNDGMPQ